MLSLLGLVLASTPASTGCFNGGAFVGAQGGFTHIMLKRLAKDKAITKDEAEKQVKLFAEAAPSFVEKSAKKADYDDVKTFDADTYSVKVDLTDLKTATGDDLKTAATRVVDAIKAAVKTDDGRKSKSVKLLVLQDKAAADFTGSLAGADAFKDFKDEKKRDAFAKELVNSEAEAKYTSNNGFAGLHVGYLGRVNDKFLVGGLVEGNWVFGQNLKEDKEELKETKARFNVNVFLRAMFNLTDKFMAGADLGFSGQEIRQEKEVGKKDKESKWFWNPAARLVLGVTLTDNILATAHVGGVFPMMKQDSLKDKSVKAKYSNFHGGVGISYVFGG